MSLEEQELSEILEENIMFGQLATFLHNMAACGNALSFQVWMLCFIPILISRDYGKTHEPEEQELAKILEENITFGQLATFLHNMAACENPLLTSMLCFFPIVISRGQWRHMSLEEQELAEILEENITFGELATFLHNMAACGNPLLTFHVVFLSHLDIQGSRETHEPGGAGATWDPRGEHHVWWAGHLPA